MDNIVYGQNGIEQNGIDKMVRIKSSTDQSSPFPMTV